MIPVLRPADELSAKIQNFTVELHCKFDRASLYLRPEITFQSVQFRPLLPLCHECEPSSPVPLRLWTADHTDRNTSDIPRHKLVLFTSSVAYTASWPDMSWRWRGRRLTRTWGRGRARYFQLRPSICGKTTAKGHGRQQQRYRCTLTIITAL